MVSVIPVTFITMSCAVVSAALASNFIRIAGLIIVAAHLSTKGYRPGEGPLSPKMPVRMVSGKGIGGILHEMSEVFGGLVRFRGVTFYLTRSESRSLNHLINAALDNDSALPALSDFLENFPEGRKR